MGAMQSQCPRIDRRAAEHARSHSRTAFTVAMKAEQTPRCILADFGDPTTGPNASPDGGHRSAYSELSLGVENACAC
jgi:hypothetical protein